MVNQDVKTLSQALHNGVIHLQKGKALRMLLVKLNRTGSSTRRKYGKKNKR